MDCIERTDRAISKVDNTTAAIQTAIKAARKLKDRDQLLIAIKQANDLIYAAEDMLGAAEDLQRTIATLEFESRK